MLRTAGAILAVFAVLVTATPADAKRPKKADPAPKLDSAATIEKPDAQALLREGENLWHLKNDYDGALAKLNAAVEAGPKDTQIRLQRAHFFETVSGIVVSDEVEKFKSLAHDDYLRISQDDPDSITAGIARDGLTRLSGKTLLESPSVECSPEANKAHDRAESLFGARRFDDALAEYEKAATACPTSAIIWVHYGDAYFLLEQYDKAKELFGKALAVDPWNRAGHRFLADTEAKLSNREAMLRELELAVVSDPLYEAGWSSLRTHATVIGRKWTRAYGVKTAVTRGPDTKGEKTINIAVNPEKKSDTSNTKGTDGSLWMGYGLFKASVYGGSTSDIDADGNEVERKLDPDKMSALEIERESVKPVLQMAREIETNSGEKPGPFWSMMVRADTGGFLDEAIFLHMLDEPLAAEYPAFREKNAERLVTYLDTIIVP